MELGVRPSASASITSVFSMLVSACWYKTMAMGEIGEGEKNGTSSIKAGMTGKVYVELVVEVMGGVTKMLSWK